LWLRKTLSPNQHLNFNERFPAERGLAGSPSIFSIYLFWKKTFQDNLWTDFDGCPVCHLATGKELKESGMEREWTTMNQPEDTVTDDQSELLAESLANNGGR